MGQSSFAHSLFTSTCVAGVVFSATALPFAALKTNVVNLEIQNQPVFTSELKFLAAPYLAIAGGISAAVGVGVFGVLGWRDSAQKLAGSESTKAELAKRLASHQAELERIKFSESRLRTQDLTAFLQPSESAWVGIEAPKATIATPEPSLGKSTKHLEQGEVNYHAKGIGQPETNGHSHGKFNANHSNLNGAHHGEQEPLESLLSQLQHLSRQVEELRNNSASQWAA
ncbi:MAG TPA: hypothetical protein IGR64_12020 [Leptolyngbyaceae cyanobacterium M65_K2018_010]|nr:hypothetical protein [Leptolyngbyaceae cyanobacterium M65_K2018_010]